MQKLAFLLLFFAVACHKRDETAPVIQRVSPNDNAIFQGGESVSIKGTISDNEGIHMVHIMVFDKSDYSHVLHFEEHFDAKTYQFNKTFTAEKGKAYSIYIDASDHSENISKEELTVSAN